MLRTTLSQFSRSLLALKALNLANIQRLLIRKMQLWWLFIQNKINYLRLHGYKFVFPTCQDQLQQATIRTGRGREAHGRGRGRLYNVIISVDPVFLWGSKIILPWKRNSMSTPSSCWRHCLDLCGFRQCESCEQHEPVKLVWICCHGAF